MATLYPDQIQTFPHMLDITADDAVNINRYQQAMNEGNIEEAREILTQIINADRKILSANYINTISDTVYELEKKYNEKYSPAYIVSSTQPSAGTQEPTDFWFKIIGVV